MSQVSVSIVVPVYSGGQYLMRLLNEIELLRVRWSGETAPMRLLEVILVDDAAIDDSPAIMDRLAAEKGWITAIHLSRNFGQHAATIAGILHSSGDWIVTLDEDLQHPPSQIDFLLQRAGRTSSDVIYAQPEGPVHEKYSRDITSRLYKRMIAFISGNKNVEFFNSFRLIRGAVARAASSICGHDTYFDIALSWFTQRVDVIAMDLKDERVVKGESSGYKLSALFSHARRMLMSGHIKVMRVCAMFGFVVVLISFFGAIALMLLRVLAPETITLDGWTSLSLTVIFFGGITTLLVGIALEYLSILALASHGKPLFFVVDRQSDTVLLNYFCERNDVNLDNAQ